MNAIDFADQIKRARRHRGWSQARLLQELRNRAGIEGVQLMNTSSLRVALSRWENGHNRPDLLYTRLLASTLGLPETPGGEGDPEYFRHIRSRLDAFDLATEDKTVLAEFVGSVVELDQSVDIAIDNAGWSTVTYRHTLFNMSGRPLTRIVRELWFEHTCGPLKIVPTHAGMTIERVHDTPNLAKFACKMTPSVEPGAIATIGYTSVGGRFVSDHYWRQSLPRYTANLNVCLRHHGIDRVLECVAVEEHPDGAEVPADTGMHCTLDGQQLTMSVTRTRLRPNQAVTIRWEVDHGTA